MSQKRDMAEKIKLMLDGEELKGLVNFGEIALEKGEIEVPEFHKIRKIQNGMSKVPAVDLIFKISRDSDILKKLRDWYMNDESHDLVKIRCDAHGVEFARTLMSDCECVLYKEPQFDGMNPTYAQVPIKVLAWEITPIDAQ